jgi:hypothetical protein
MVNTWFPAGTKYGFEMVDIPKTAHLISKNVIN